MQIASFLCSIILSRVACLAVTYFSISSHERHVILKKVIEHKVYFVVLSKTFLIQDELSQLFSQMCTSLHIKYPLFLQNFNET